MQTSGEFESSLASRSSTPPLVAPTSADGGAGSRAASSGVAVIVGSPRDQAIHAFIAEFANAKAGDDPFPQLFLVADTHDAAVRLLKLAHHYGASDCAIPYVGTLFEFLNTSAVEPAALLAELPSEYVAADALLRAISWPGVRCVAFLDAPTGESAVRALRTWCAARDVTQIAPKLGGAARYQLRGGPSARRIPTEKFAAARDTLQAALFAKPSSASVADPCAAEAHSANFRAAMESLRAPAFVARATSSAGRAGWPYVAPQALPLPATMPSGRPWPRISVITPSFNQGDYIEQTLLSVANQGYPDIEHIVIDGGSRDATGEILARWRERLAYCVSEKDRGQSHAINKGFERATGELLMWLNSDDLLAPGALAAAALALDRSGADMVAGICEIHRDGETIERHLTCCDDGPLPLADLLDIEFSWMGGQFFYQPEVIFTRDLWRRSGARVDEAWFYSMDYELWLRFAQAGARLTVIGRPIAQFRVHPEQKTNLAEKFRAELDRVVADFTARTGVAPAQRTQTELGRTRLRIAFFNDIGYMAGAGLAHERLARACATAGHEVLALHVSDGSTLDRTPPTTAAALIARLDAVAPDCVVIGNLHSAALAPEVLGQISGRWPTLFVLHDQWAITGRCAYTGGCEKYRTGCDHTCPTPDEYPALPPQRIAEAWRMRRMVYGAANPPVLLANSTWMHEFAAGGLPAPEVGGPPRGHLQTIRLGVPTDVFHPRDAAHCREHFGLPHDRFIIMTSGTSADDPRKGISHLAEALRRLALPNVLVVSVGHADPSRPPPIPGMRAMGYLRDPRELAMLYAAADIFVGPSLQEAFGQVFVEAAACGTPAIGYPVGGVPEAIIDGVSGRIAKSVTPAALADAIIELYADAAYRRNLAAWGRILVENEFSLETAYQRFYTALVRSGTRDRLGLRRKIWLAPQLAPSPGATCIDSTYPAWRAVRGFDHWEGPYPADALPRCRWALGPVSTFEFAADSVGQRVLLIECRNYWERQQVRILVNGQHFGEMGVPVTRNESVHTIVVPIDVVAGKNTVELHHWQWDTSQPQRQIALLILGIQIAART